MIKSIFLVDDDQDDRDFFFEALGEIGRPISIQSAVNGKEALNGLMLLETKPEIILLDINMPEMNGWDCLLNLKKNETLQHIPVLMFSTSSANINGKRAVETGAVGYLEKPPSYLKLKDFLEMLTRNSSPPDLLETLRMIKLTKKLNLFVA